MIDPRDRWYLDEAAALLVIGPEGSSTLAEALAGADLKTPAYLSADGVVLLFASPEGVVRRDLAGVSVLDGDDLPELVEWLADSEGLPLASMPSAFLVKHDPDQMIADDPATTEPAADDLASLAHDSDAANAMAILPAPAERVPIDLSTRAGGGGPIEWRIVAGQLIVTEAPIDPRAAPTERQREAVALLLSLAEDGGAPLATWREACRSAWGLSASSGLTAFKRVAVALVERGAIKIDGDQVHVVATTDACVAPGTALSRSESGPTAPCHDWIGRLSERLISLSRFRRTAT